jgi:REP element-mobilizing transposase RayT
MSASGDDQPPFVSRDQLPGSCSSPGKILVLKMTLEPLEPGGLYHLYNHAVGKENLFLSHDNYSYFLERYRFFATPVVDTYVYCLMPNHLHVVVEVRRDISLPTASKYTIPKFVSKQFSNLFSSYAQAFNKQQSRRGNLFMSQFRRQPINSDEYLTNVIRYVHFNPVHHGFTNDFSTWKYSSYSALCSGVDTFLARDKVMKWFGNVHEFEKAHKAFKWREANGFFGSCV